MSDIKEVAQRAGVSIATVSRVLNNSGPVSEKSRKKVCDAVEALDYKRNNLARSFRMRRSGSLMMISNDIRNPFLPPIVRGMEDAAAQMGYSLLIGNADNSSEKVLHYLNDVMMHKADGVILMTPCCPHDKLIEFARAVPMVLLNTHLGHDIPSIGIDDTAAFACLAEHLISLGHRNIVYFAAARIGVAEKRLQGYRSALEKHQIPFKREFVLQIENTTMASGYDGMARLLERRERPTAVMAYNDQIAIGALRCAKEHGVRVPEDISITGFDDIAFSTAVEPALTTVHQPAYEMGKMAAERLFDVLNGTACTQHTQLPEWKLIVRASTGPASR